MRGSGREKGWKPGEGGREGGGSPPLTQFPEESRKESAGNGPKESGRKQSIDAE